MADEKNEKKDRVLAVFLCRPAGRQFGWKGILYPSDAETGVLEVKDADFAEALRADVKRGISGLEEIDSDDVGKIRRDAKRAAEGPAAGERVVGAPAARQS